jgi:DNA-binding NarL/FixJ family response regulator
MTEATPSKHSILIIDDHPIIHDGLKILMETEQDMEIVAEAHSAAEAMEQLKKQLPDIAIVDLSLGDSDGTYLIQQIMKKYPKLRVLVYTMSEEKLFAERTAAAGAHGYVMKTTPPAILKAAIRTVLAGGLHFTPETLQHIQNESDGRKRESHTLVDRLSNREMDIFKLVGHGMDTVSIAAKLNISRNTVDTHRINIKNKLNLPSGKAVEHFAYEVIKQGKLPKA